MSPVKAGWMRWHCRPWRQLDPQGPGWGGQARIAPTRPGSAGVAGGDSTEPGDRSGGGNGFSGKARRRHQQSDRFSVEIVPVPDPTCCDTSHNAPKSIRHIRFGGGNPRRRGELAIRTLAPSSGTGGRVHLAGSGEVGQLAAASTIPSGRSERLSVTVSGFAPRGHFDRGCGQVEP